MTWHKRLGHVDPRRIVSTFDFGSAAGLLLKDAQPDPKRTVNIRLPECEICKLCSTRAVPVPKTRTSIETDPAACGDVVYSDVKSVSYESIFGHRYVIVFVDVWSR